MREFSRRKTRGNRDKQFIREFRVMIIRILNSMKKVIETIKENHSEIKNAASEINNTPEGVNSRLDEA